MQGSGSHLALCPQTGGHNAPHPLTPHWALSAIFPTSPRRAARDPALSPCTPHLPHIPLLGPTPSPLPTPNTVSRHVPLLRPGPRGTRCPLPTGPFTGPNAVAPHVPSTISLHWVLIIPLCPLTEPSLRRVPAPSPLTMPPLASPHPTAPLVSGGGPSGTPHQLLAPPSSPHGTRCHLPSPPRAPFSSGPPFGGWGRPRRAPGGGRRHWGGPGPSPPP